MRTRAAILSQVNEPLAINDVEIGEPQFGEVLVQMVASGVCHTDVSVMHGLLPLPLPAILGHEGAGIIQAVGPGVTKLSTGDHVVVAAVPHCGQCRSCLQGKRSSVKMSSPSPSVAPCPMGRSAFDGTQNRSPTSSVSRRSRSTPSYRHISPSGSPRTSPREARSPGMRGRDRSRSHSEHRARPTGTERSGFWLRWGRPERGDGGAVGQGFPHHRGRRR
jgi:hypothetical protein